MIRAGEESDLDDIVSMARVFWSETIYEEEYCPDTVRGMARMCLDQSMLSVLEVDGSAVGFACGIVGGLLANGSVKSGTEIAWWVNKEHRSGRNGISLLKHIEGQARSAGVKYWNMVYMQSSMPDSIQGIYEKMGYKKSEVVYTRIL